MSLGGVSSCNSLSSLPPNYVLVEWMEEGNPTSVKPIKLITKPSKSPEEYKEGETVEVIWQGKDVYPAEILKLSAFKDELVFEQKRLQDLAKTTSEKSKVGGSVTKLVAKQGKTLPKPSKTPTPANKPTRQANGSENRQTTGSKKTGQKRRLAESAQDVLNVSDFDKYDAAADETSAETCESSSSDAPGEDTEDNQGMLSSQLKEASPSNFSRHRDSGHTSMAECRVTTSEWNQLTSRIKELEGDVERLQHDMSRMKRFKTEQLSSGKHASAEPAAVEKVAGHVVEDLRQLIAHISKDDSYNAVKILMNKLFTTHELKTSSISGKRTPKCSGPTKLPLDSTKISLVQRLTRELNPEGMNHKMLYEKMQNVLKVARRA